MFKSNRVKAQLGAFNKEKVLVGAFSGHCETPSNTFHLLRRSTDRYIILDLDTDLRLQCSRNWVSMDSVWWMTSLWQSWGVWEVRDPPGHQATTSRRAHSVLVPILGDIITLTTISFHWVHWFDCLITVMRNVLKRFMFMLLTDCGR